MTTITVVVAMLVQLGVSALRFASHSLRKGARTYCGSRLRWSGFVSQQDPCSEAGLGGSEPTVHAGDSIGPPTGIPPFILTAVEQRRHAKKIEALDHERNEGTDFC